MISKFPAVTQHVVFYPVVEVNGIKDLSSTCVTVLLENNKVNLGTLRIVQQKLTHAQASSLSSQLASSNYPIEEAKYVEARFSLGSHNLRNLPTVSFGTKRVEDLYPEEFVKINTLLQQLY